MNVDVMIHPLALRLNHEKRIKEQTTERFDPWNSACVIRVSRGQAAKKSGQEDEVSKELHSLSANENSVTRKRV